METRAEQRLKDGAGLLRRPEQRPVVDVERDLDASPGGLADRIGDRAPRALGERRGDAGHEQDPRIEQRIPVERLGRDLPERGVEAVVRHLRRQRRIAGLHEIERHPALAADAVRQIDTDAAVLVDEPLGEIAMRDDRGERRPPPKLGQQAGDVGFGAGRGQPQLPAGGQAVAARDREADLRFSKRRQIIGAHWVRSGPRRCDRSDAVMTATPGRWPASARWQPPADPSRRRSNARR